MTQSELDNRYMEFRLGEQLYAVPLLIVKEVISKPETTVVPNMPAHFEGMINLRGQILGVFNVRKKLGSKAKEATQNLSDVVIVIEDRGVSVGMIVDEVTRVLHAEGDAIGPAPLKHDDPAKRFVSSVIRNEGELIIVLETGDLLELEKYKQTQKAA
jgi:purine-binding chemotaxis protein CheW